MIRNPKCVQTLIDIFVGDEMSHARKSFCILALTSLAMSVAVAGMGQESSSAWPPTAAPAAATPTLTSPALQGTQPTTPYMAAWPQPGQDVRPGTQPRPDWTAAESSQPVAPMLVSAPVPVERLVTSTWYFRQESFYWNERLDSKDFVNERGPLSTLGYVRRNGFERFRFELFGGTVAYDGGAQFDDGSYEAYHQSAGTNYLGVRGEYDILIEPASWTRLRAFVGVGTRFWMRDLRDAVTPSGAYVFGYQEDWWTFFPYVGLETKESDEPGWKFFGSARFGITPLTHQYVGYFDTTLWPKCGLTGKAEFGVRYQKFSVSAYLEAMTWGQSEVVAGSLQPESRMLTIGGQLSYTF
jgi:hypothetical protein